MPAVEVVEVLEGGEAFSKQGVWESPQHMGGPDREPDLDLEECQEL